MAEIVIAYWFIWVLGANVQHVGPFSTDSQCEQMRKWAARQVPAIHSGSVMSTVSECTYGPQVAVLIEKKR